MDSDVVTEVIQLLAFNHLGQKALFDNPYHIEVVRRDLTRNLVTLFPQIHDEISEAFKGRFSSCLGVFLKADGCRHADYVPMSDGRHI
jgi:hypothetical protein